MNNNSNPRTPDDAGHRQAVGSTPQGAESASISSFRAWSVVSILLVLVTFAIFDRQAVTLMVDPIKASFGISDARMGFLQGPAFAAFLLLGSLPMGWIIDRFSPRITLYLGVTGWSLATIFSAFSGSFAQLLIARCLLGLGQAVLQPASWSIVAKLFPPNRLALAISVMSMGAQIGAASSYVLGGLLIAEADHIASLQLPLIGGMEPWQLVFLAPGVPGLLLAFLIFVAPESRSRMARGTGKAAPLVPFIRANRAFLTLHFLGFSLLCALVYGSANWAPTFLLRTFGLDIKSVGLILALIAVPIGTAEFMANGWAADRAFTKGHSDAHLRHFAYVCTALVFVGGLGFFLASPLWGIVLCLAVVSFLQPFTGVAAAALQITTPPELRGRISAVFIMVYNAFGMTVGPSFVALVADNLSFDNSLAIAMGLNFVLFGGGAALCFWFGRKHAVSALMRVRQSEAAA